MTFFAFLTELFLAIVSLSFLIYAFLEWKNTQKATKHSNFKAKKESESTNQSPTLIDYNNLPTVCVLLPVYNEINLIERLINSISELEYPKDKLEIWLLDDSKNSMPLAKKLVEEKALENIPIYYAHRGHNRGYKAGNLTYGLSLAKGDFVAIFDADFIPEKEFLLKTIPYFNDKNIGYLQTSVDYSNKNISPLTKFQAMMAHHKEDVTVGQSISDCVASLTGSSCVWRRECIEEIGGIVDNTITEDMDMGLRAQLSDWKYSFVNEVTSFAELPETMSAFRVQRERWGRGHIQNCLKHFKDMSKHGLTLYEKLNGFSFMTAPLLLISFYIIVLLALPLTFLTPYFSHYFNVFCTILLFSALLWAYSCFMGKGETTINKRRQRLIHRKRKRKKRFIILDNWIKFRNIYSYIIIFFPHSLYYFYALIQVTLKRENLFNTTPKGEKKAHRHKLNDRLRNLEIFSLFYTLSTFFLAFSFSNYWICLYSFISCSGFAFGLYMSYCDYKKAE